MMIIRQVRIAFSALLFLLAACGQEVSTQQGAMVSETGKNFSAPLPIRLLKVFNGTLSAEVAVDGGVPILLTIDPGGTAVSGRIDNLSPGNHVFVIKYFIAGHGNKVMIATATTNATITAEAVTAVAFSLNGMIYPDDDHDGFTNLAEVEVGTDPNNAADHPPGEWLRNSANYALNSVIGISSVVGEGNTSAPPSTPLYKITSAANAAPAVTPPPSSIESRSANYILGP